MTVGKILADATARLRAAGIEQPAREARLLLAEATGADGSALVAWPERPVPEEAAARFGRLIDRRAAHEPYSRIVGRREFWSLDFEVTPDTLDPRPETETIVESALAQIPDRTAPLRILDIGTGTGCILVALLSELPNATGLGIDRSERALRVARGNAERLGYAGRTAFAAMDWASAIGGTVDLIVSNPPYIATADIAGLPLEVRAFDPPGALDGGPDGLDAYRALAAAAGSVLADGGLVVFEVGAGQSEAVSALLAVAGFGPVAVSGDLAGIPRAVVARIGPSRK